MIPRITALLVLMLSTLLLSGCLSTHNTEITRSARAKDHAPGDHVKDVLVVALVNDAKIRQALEAHVVAELNRRDVNAAEGLPVLGEDYGKGKTRHEMAVDVASRGYQSVMVISVIDVKEEMHYNQGGMNYAGDIPVQGAFGQTFYVRQSTVYEPGYFSNEKRFFLETNLYRLQPEGLVWSAKSTTINPANLEAGTTGLAEALIDRLAKDDMI